MKRSRRSLNSRQRSLGSKSIVPPRVWAAGSFRIADTGALHAPAPAGAGAAPPDVRRRTCAAGRARADSGGAARIAEEAARIAEEAARISSADGRPARQLPRG